MSEFIPVSTVAELSLLDEQEMVEGYLSGLSSSVEPGSDKSKAFWHGWRNGMSDKGFAPVDRHQHALAAEIGKPTRIMKMI